MENKFMDWASQNNRIIIETKNKTRDDECVVCLDTLLNKNIAYLPCKHSFHYECIKPWVEKNKSCPICFANWIYKNKPEECGGYKSKKNTK